MSHKVGMLGQGKGDENSIRQAVVRIDSTQTLIKGVDGKVVKGTGEPTKTVEYIVLSKRRKEGVPEGPWVVWGTVTESGSTYIFRSFESLEEVKMLTIMQWTRLERMVYRLKEGIRLLAVVVEGGVGNRPSKPSI